MASEDTDFVGYGSAVEQLQNDESLSKYATENKLKAQKVRDKQGRERFHGAFTGGYSAGYYNTVGTAEGWTPSTYTSSRKKSEGNSNQNRPEHYMDDEDLEQFGIAPRQIRTTDDYSKNDTKTQRAAWDPVVPGLSDTISQIVKPVQISAAVKLLRLMGWKHGQGIGPRVKRKRGQPRVVGPSMPSEYRTTCADDEESDDEFTSHMTFAPKDMNPIKFDVKDDLHGIGYAPLSIHKSKSSKVEEDRLTFGGHSKGISGKAFGVGIEEDDDDIDVYGKDKMSDYDMSLGDEPEDLHNFTKPKGKRKQLQQQPIYQSSAVLEGFCLAKKTDKLSDKYTVPELPRGYRPSAVITGVSELPKLYGKLDKTLRGLLIGESIKDGGLLPPEDELKQSAPLLPGKSVELSLNDNKPPQNQQYEEEDKLEAPNRPTEPLNKQSVDFKPFSKNPDKQARYDRYLMLRRTGDPGAYDKVAPPEFRRHERDREREEFERSGKFFKDLSGVMASRFTHSKQTEDDDSKVSVRVDEEMEDMTDTKKQAVQMKMFGQLTRESYEWHPHRVMCRRFNIPDPYPDSRLVGLPTVTKDKISAYNFLDVESLTKTPAELKEIKDARYEAEDSKSKARGKSDNSDSKETGPKSLADGEKAPVDLFKAVFQDSDDSDESDTESEVEEDQSEDGIKDEPAAHTILGNKQDTSTTTQSTKSSNLRSISEKYSQSRTVSSMYESSAGGYIGQDICKSTVENISDEPVRIKFVPKKDRHKNQTKTKKSRWALHTDTAEATTEESQETNSVIKTEPLTEVAAAGNETLVTSGVANTGDISSAKDNPKESISTIAENGVPVRTPPSSDQEDSYTPTLPPNIANNCKASGPLQPTGEGMVEAGTPPTSDDDEAWMPALPPGLTKGEANINQSDNDVADKSDRKSRKKSKHKHHKDRHKKSKSKKSHKSKR